jgi:hypothetical protein
MTDWDDERLGAAFADRYDRPAPRDLDQETLRRVGETRRRPAWWPHIERRPQDRLVGAAVAVVAVVALVATVVLPRASSEPTGSAAVSSEPGNVASPGRDSPSLQAIRPSPFVDGFATDVAGLKVRPIGDVPRLLADPTVGDTELAIAGWYSASDLVLPCPYQAEPISAVEIRCPDVHAWLSATDRPILSPSGSLDQATDPAGLLALRFIAPAEPVGGDGGPRVAMNTTPQAVVVVGHFHDERSARCPSAERLTCEQTFVVDVTSSAYGTLFDRPTSAIDPAPKTRLSAAEALRLAQDRVGEYATVLQIGLDLGSDPPWFTTKAGLDCLCPATWFARGWRYRPDGTTDLHPANTAVASWLVIDDATGTISGPLVDGIPAPTDAADEFQFAPPPDGFPTTIEGLPVRTVADIADPDRPRPLQEDTPIAVAGWFTQLPDDTVVLAGTPERLVSYAPGGVASLVPSTGPILYPAVVPGGALPPPVQIATPIGAVFILRDGPLDLEQVAWLNGAAQKPAEWIAPGLVPQRSAQQVLRETDGGAFIAPGTWPISISAVRFGDLATIGIASGQSGDPRDPDPIVWAVRMAGLQPGAPTANGYGWTLVDDATGQDIEGAWTSP